MSKIRLVAFVTACLVCGTATAQDGSIGMYLDDAGTQCEAMSSGGFITGSIWMNLAGATASGFQSVEFRVDNSNPEAYAVIAQTPTPDANIVLGQPFATPSNTVPGCNVAFPVCQPQRVKLFSILIQELVPTQDVTFTVRQHYTPWNDTYRCPLAVLCDEPVYTMVCVGARESDHFRAVINPSDGISGDCLPVAVQPTSWSSVKSLYSR